MNIVWKRGLTLILVSLMCGCGGSTTPSAAGDPYSTNFPLTEDPISEGGKWVNGGATGLDWTNVSTTPGRAIGHEVGANFTDAIAILQGLTWQADQKATGVVFALAAPLENCSQEVELLLRYRVAAHSITGYEINYKVSSSSSAYMQIVRWNGAVGDFTFLEIFNGAQFGVSNGDTVMATVVGNVITAYKNGVQLGQVTDSTYSSGSPGIGFNLDNTVSGCSGTNANYGFSSFTAADSSGSSF
jgi:hypothetical protein